MLKIQEIMASHGESIDEDSAALLMDDLHAVIEMNQTLNLTRIVSEDAGIVRHLEDSLLGLKYVDGAPEGLYGDLGTGGGFPGIPIAIITHRKTVLVDSVQKKINALLSIVEELGLSSQVSGYAGRIEDLAIEKPCSFSVLTARALSSLPSLMELSSPLLSKDGLLICYKAKPEQEEIDAAIRLENTLGMQLVSRETFELSDGSTRCFFVFKKVGKPKIKLPRRVGMAQRNPLMR